jgi:hypothetical protein
MRFTFLQSSQNKDISFPNHNKTKARTRMNESEERRLTLNTANLKAPRKGRID